MSQPFSACALSPARHRLVWLSRETLLGRGKLRHLLWRQLHIGVDEAVDIAVGSVNMRLFPASNSVEQKLLLRPEKYCPTEIQALDAALGSTGCLVDIGANIGAFSLPLAKSSPKRKIIAVEPNPMAADRLMFNKQINGLDNLMVHRLALSDSDGTISFTADPHDLKLSGINPPHGKGQSIDVLKTSLQKLLKQEQVERVDALKIDVEGHEDMILMPFFRDAPKKTWPKMLVIEAIPREGLPETIGFMLKNGYHETFRTRANRGFVLETLK